MKAKIIPAVIIISSKVDARAAIAPARDRALRAVRTPATPLLAGGHS